MSEQITYLFTHNEASITDIGDYVKSVEGVRLDIESLFNSLQGVYHGADAGALQTAHGKINDMMDEALTTMAQTQRQAQDQQDVMKAMDLANAHDMGG